MRCFDFDALIVGAGTAGVSTAAALGRQGLRVLVVDRGDWRVRPFSGEVLHPQAVAGLEELGIADTAMRLEGISLRAFRVVPGRHGPTAINLPYPPGGPLGLAIGHRALGAALRAGLKRLPSIAFMERTRLRSLVRCDSDRVEAVIRDADGDALVRCRLLVGADGQVSQTGRLVGIATAVRRLSTAVVCTIPAGALAPADVGSVFLTAGAPALAYPVSATQARVVFDIDHADTQVAFRGEVRGHRAKAGNLLHDLPPPLRAALRPALAKAVLLPIQESAPDRVAAGPVVLVGDAAGRCHPLTASGMTACLRDASVLEAAVARHWPDVARTLDGYARARREPQRTRYMVANVLRETLDGRSAGILRDGLLDHWCRDGRGRATSMALLTGDRSNAGAVAAEAARVLWRGIRHGRQRNTVFRSCLETAVEVVDLIRMLHREARNARRSA